MLRHLGYGVAADRIDGAVDDTLREGQIVTPDLGGTSGTADVVDAVLRKI